MRTIILNPKTAKVKKEGMAEFCENQKKLGHSPTLTHIEAVYLISENFAHQTWRCLQSNE